MTQALYNINLSGSSNRALGTTQQGPQLHSPPQTQTQPPFIGPTPVTPNTGSRSAVSTTHTQPVPTPQQASSNNARQSIPTDATTSQPHATPSVTSRSSTPVAPSQPATAPVPSSAPQSQPQAPPTQLPQILFSTTTSRSASPTPASPPLPLVPKFSPIIPGHKADPLQLRKSFSNTRAVSGRLHSRR